MSEQPAFKTGDKVAIMVYRNRTSECRGIYEVERETKTQYIVNGRRFRKRNNRELGDFGTWTPIPELLPVDDPRVIHALSEQRVDRSYSKTITAIRDYEKDRNNLALLNIAIGALVAHGVLMEAEAAK